MEFRQSPNYTKGGINYDGSVRWLTMSKVQRGDGSESSAHYVIAKDGRTVQLVQNTDTAWHAGRVHNPSPYAQKVLLKGLTGFKNPNTSFLGIEFEWFVGDSLTEVQYEKALNIIKDSGIKNPILIGHKDIASFKADDMEFACIELRKRLVPVVDNKALILQKLEEIKQLL
jgi:N-acetyl-anhydromuramyl-L-alanine amidase AmpD